MTDPNVPNERDLVESVVGNLLGLWRFLTGKDAENDLEAVDFIVLYFLFWIFALITTMVVGVWSLVPS